MKNEKTACLVVAADEAAEFRRRLMKDAPTVSFTDRRHWLFWRRFTITGPEGVVELVLQRREKELDKEFWDRQW